MGMLLKPPELHRSIASQPLNVVWQCNASSEAIFCTQSPPSSSSSAKRVHRMKRIQFAATLEFLCSASSLSATTVDVHALASAGGPGGGGGSSHGVAEDDLRSKGEHLEYRREHMLAAICQGWTGDRRDRHGIQRPSRNQRQGV